MIDPLNFALQKCTLKNTFHFLNHKSDMNSPGRITIQRKFVIVCERACAAHFTPDQMRRRWRYTAFCTPCTTEHCEISK